MHRLHAPPARALVQPQNLAVSDKSVVRESDLSAGDALPCKDVGPGLAGAANREVLDTEGAAEYLGVSRQLLELLRVAGGGPRYAKLGRLVRYRRAALNAWLIERERSHTAEGATPCGTR